MRFCLEDGTSLATITRAIDPPPTAILSREPPTQRSSAPTIPSYPNLNVTPAAAPPERQSNSILTAGVIVIALLLLALVGIAAFYVIKQSSGNESAQVNPSSSPTAKPTATPSVKGTPTDQGDIVSTTPGNGGPLKITASSSSVRLAVQTNTYYPSNTIDGKRATAWIEGVDGVGIGEWIQYDFDREINVHRILIQPGYFKSPAIWSQNNRLATVTARFSDGSSRQLNFDDIMQSQKVDVGSIKTRWVRLVIESVYYGSDPDTAISEVAFEWD
ncbi:MAG TPA: discoidin domain-containing protein [Pyrinomonadaceae bacterium]|nr:discoidin domain-containing protein [Pyrinomonadaceae bacterium]